MRGILIAVVGVVLFSGSIAAEPDVMSGNGNLAYCRQASGDRPGGGFNAGYCLGVVRAIWVTLNAYERVCAPRGVNNGQMARVLVRYMETHPERLHESLEILTMSALSEAFPCKKN